MSNLLPESIREELLARIIPTQDEIDLQTRVINQLTQALKERAKEGQFRYAFIEPQGSTGKKQTQLRGVADIDLFVALNPDEYPQIFTDTQTPDRRVIDEIMSDLVAEWFEPAVKKLHAEKIQRAFSQHPFLSLVMDGIDVDILGCFDLEADILAERGPITAVDRTIHHSSYIAERMTERKREDTRILKSFVRANHAYGDMCAVGRMGLTGVTLEIIVLNEPNLESAFRSLHNLDTKPIDPLSRSLEEMRKIQSFRDDHVFLIDPTDHSRNMASSFSKRSYTWVQHRIERLWSLIEKEDNSKIIDLFLERPIPSRKLSGWIKDHSAVREYNAEGEVHYTILRDKLHSLARKLCAEMKNERTGEQRFGETFSEIYFHDDQYALAIIVENPHISEAFDRRGPATSLKDPVERFREKHQEGVFEREGFLYIKEKREWVDFIDMFNSILNQNEIEGLTLQKDSTIVSRQALNVLSNYVLSLESDFVERITRVKEREKDSFR